MKPLILFNVHSYHSFTSKKLFLLPEGHTVFLERKIGGRLFGGEPCRDFAALSGWNNLKDAVDERGEKNPLTALQSC